MKITIMTYGHPFWEKTAAFAQKCSWRAGAFLAGKMRDNEFSDIERVIVASEGDFKTIYGEVDQLFRRSV